MPQKNENTLDQIREIMTSCGAKPLFNKSYTHNNIGEQSTHIKPITKDKDYRFNNKD